MALAVTAQDEILKRIKELDRAEGIARRRTEEHMRDAATAEAEAEALARKRRQYEFALQQLGGEFPRETRGKFPVKKKSGTVVGVLG